MSPFIYLISICKKKKNIFVKKIWLIILIVIFTNSFLLGLDDAEIVGLTSRSLKKIIEKRNIIQANFSYSPLVTEPGKAIKFYNDSTGNPDKYLWSFGDGKISQDKDPIHIYEKPALYNVVLCVSRDNLASLASKLIFIKKNADSATGQLKADFSYEPKNPEAGSVVSFYDKSIGNPEKRVWEFGYFGKSLLKNPQKIFLSEGKYKISLTVENQFETDTATQYIEIRPRAKNVILANSCSLKDVREAIKKANPGDTVIVPSGEAHWTQQLIIIKGIILKAAVKGGVTIYADYQAPNNYGFDSSSYLIVYNPSQPETDPVFRLSGFKIISPNSTTQILQLKNFNVNYPVKRIRIDNNFIKSGRRVLGIIGAVYGVADNNTFEDASIISYGANEDSWSRLTFDYGTADNFYIEDNKINLTSGSVSGGAGGRYAFRNNIWTYTYNSGLYPWFDAHGNQGIGNNHATMGVEIYNETMYFNMPSGYGINIFDIRGGKALIYNVNVIFQNSGTPGGQVREEVDDSLNPPATNPAGQPQHPSDCYFFLLRKNGSTQVNVGVGQQVYYDGKGYVPTEDKEFWLEKSTFNGSSGIGVGPLSARPSTCTKEGVAWWATDENRLYRWKNGRWELYYTPYTYPHPLRTILGD